jgi:homoaconitase/3-isopropylmalate dehydratase large subunit
LRETGHFVLSGGVDMVKLLQNGLADHVSTDEFYPVRYSSLADDFGQAALTGFRTQKIQLGDLASLNCDCLVLGQNAGCGSAREHAAVCLYDAGIRLVCAVSFNATFRRNLIHCGCVPATDLSLALKESVTMDDVPDLSEYERDILKHGGLPNAPVLVNSSRCRRDAAMTMTEKILAQHAGIPCIRAGDEVNVTPDVVFTYDVHVPLLRRALAGAERLRHPCILAFDDHFSVNPGFGPILEMLYEFTERYGIVPRFLSHENGGVCHSVIRDYYAAPGGLVAGTDSHTSTCGIRGALGLAVGAAEAAAAMKNGAFAVTVPESVKVVFHGRLADCCAVKDVVLYLLNTEFVRDGKTLGRFLEFDMLAMRDRSDDELTVLCNMAAEMGAWGGIAIPASHDAAVSPDADASYADIIEINLSQIVPAVAMPHNPANYTPLSELRDDIPIHKIFIGSCTGGLFNDIRIAADILRKSRVAEGVQLFVQPASNTIYNRADALGLLETVGDAGGIVLKPGCGGCIGQGEAAIGDGENGVWNSNRNFQGRVGSPKGNVYIASTKTSVLAAIRGSLSSGMTHL